MTTTTTTPDRESPARRLEILYVASLIAVGLLWAVSQTFILRELSWQKSAPSARGLSARQRTFDRSLSLAALQAVGDPQREREAVATLKTAVERARRELRGAGRAQSQLQSAGAWAPPSEQVLRSAEPHRFAALAAAETLLATLADPTRASTTATVDPIVQTIVSEEQTFNRGVRESVLLAKEESVDHLAHLSRVEYKVTGFVLIVLLLEGLFVITPAVRRIQHFTADAARSHEEMKSYAARLERSNKELQDFASVASHDLQEPLRKVQAFGDRLKSKYGATLDDQGRDFLDRVQNAARRMQILINDLLTYARVTTKAQPFVAVDLTTATREVVADLEARIEQVNGRVEVGALPTVEADPLQVRQLMQNLIGNALKYHRPDEPPVVKVDSGPVEGPDGLTGGEQGQDCCQILIEDNGIGFDEAYTERIFTIFQRLHGRTEYEGTGVGLAVCRKIVERHKGTITARSTPGKGSTFVVMLPLHQPKEPSAPQP